MSAGLPHRLIQDQVPEDKRSPPNAPLVDGDCLASHRQPLQVHLVSRRLFPHPRQRRGSTACRLRMSVGQLATRLTREMDRRPSQAEQRPLRATSVESTCGSCSHARHTQRRLVCYRIGTVPLPTQRSPGYALRGVSPEHFATPPIQKHTRRARSLAAREAAAPPFGGAAIVTSNRGAERVDVRTGSASQRRALEETVLEPALTMKHIDAGRPWRVRPDFWNAALSTPWWMARHFAAVPPFPRPPCHMCTHLTHPKAQAFCPFRHRQSQACATVRRQKNQAPRERPCEARHRQDKSRQ